MNNRKSDEGPVAWVGAGLSHSSYWWWVLSTSYPCPTGFDLVSRRNLEGSSGSLVFLKSTSFAFESDDWHVRALGLPWDAGNLVSATEIIPSLLSSHECQFVGQGWDCSNEEASVEPAR